MAALTSTDAAMAVQGSAASKEEKKTAKEARVAAAKRLIALAKPESMRISLGIFSLLVNSVTNLSFPWILGQAVDRADDPNYFLFLSGTAGVFTVGSLATWIRVYCLGTSTERISSVLRKQLFNSYMDKEIEFFEANKSGELSTVLEKDVTAASEALTDKFAAGLRSINASLNGSILLFRSSPELCGVSLAIVPLVGVGAMTVSRYSKKIKEKLRVLQGQVLSFALERYNHISTVRLNGQEEGEKDRYSEYVDESYELSRSAYFAQGSFLSFVGMMTNVSLMAVLYCGGKLMTKGKMTAGGLTRFAIQSAFVGLGFSGLSTFYGDMTRALDAAARVFAMIDENEDHKRRKQGSSSSSSSVGTGTVALPASSEGSGLAGDVAVSLVDVRFCYPLAPDVPVLRGISLNIEKNTFTAIAGASGSGKSTILSLMCGLYRLTGSGGEVGSSGENGGRGGGSIVVCGKDITSPDQNEENESRAWLQEKISAVQQDAGLLSGSIASNITYGINKSNDVSPEKMQEAARMTQAHDFIKSLPEGYETDIGEDGSRLSGGQRARVALARAVLKGPSVLLLDEVTAALDRKNEREIIAMLQELSKTKTVVVFTHSEAVMKAADVVHVVSDGTVKSSGSFDEVKSHVNFDMN
jgi:ABC-type multidrug transport system fused ATPase/permease subunit